MEDIQLFYNLALRKAIEGIYLRKDQEESQESIIKRKYLNRLWFIRFSKQASINVINNLGRVFICR
jgi:hypothetical protein